MRSLLTYLLLFATAALAATICWLAIASTHPLTPVPQELVGLTQPTQEQMEQMRTHNRTNDTYALMMFSALCVAAGMPLYARGLRLPWQIASLVAAVAIGALTGAAMGGIGFYLHDWMPIKWDALARVAVRWMGMLLPTGLAAGLLTIVCHDAWGKWLTVLTGGVIGSIFAALAYSLTVALLFQTENSDSVLPVGTSSQLLLFILTPWFIWSTIAHQESAGPKAAAAQSLPNELEAA